MTDKRIIKKYPNRRLYDTEISKYVTLNDVRQLIIDCEPISVVDAKTKDDLTRSVLLQIILEQEEDGEPMMSAEMLEQWIRFYGDPYQNSFAKYLESTVRIIAEQRTLGRKKLGQVVDPFTMMTSIANHNVEALKEMQEDLFKNIMPLRTSNKK